MLPLWCFLFDLIRQGVKGGGSRSHPFPSSPRPSVAALQARRWPGLRTALARRAGEGCNKGKLTVAPRAADTVPACSGSAAVVAVPACGSGLRGLVAQVAQTRCESCIQMIASFASRIDRGGVKHTLSDEQLRLLHREPSRQARGVSASSVPSWHLTQPGGPGGGLGGQGGYC